MGCKCILCNLEEILTVVYNSVRTRLPLTLITHVSFLSFRDPTDVTQNLQDLLSPKQSLFVQLFDERLLH
jgi:hypothetical protein